MKKLLLLSFFLLMSLISIAQAPIISYGSSATHSYTAGSAIASLTPANTGGLVSATWMVTTLAGNGSANYLDGETRSAAFNYPTGVAVDLSGNIYVADQNNYRIRKITPTGSVTTLAGSGEKGYADGIGTSAKFDLPAGVASDKFGNVYVADKGNNRIRKITPLGMVSTLAGSGQLGSDNGVGLASSFSSPGAIATDTSGNVYVADQNTGDIRKITPTGIVSTLAGGFCANQITTDIAGNVYVADGYSIQKVTPSGIVLTLYTTSYTYARAQVGMTIDKLGNLYAADYSDYNEIRKLTSVGTLSSFVGGSPGYAEGIGTSASFSLMGALAIDALSNIYVADAGNNRIRKISFCKYAISPSLPAGLNFDVTTGTISGTPMVPSSATTYTITASNSAGIATCQVEIEIPLLATVTSRIVTNVATTTATATGTLNSLGAPNPTSYGICWSATNTLPTIADGKIDKGAATATGSFTASLTGLTPGTLYYARAYAINNVGIAYGDVMAFNTITPPPAISYEFTSSVVRSKSLRAATTTAPPVITPGTSVYHFVQGTAITPLAPISTGGTVPATIPDSVSTFAGNGNYGYADGISSSAMFSSPYGISADAENNVYIADWCNYRVRKITPAGMVSTLAGNGTSGYADGTGTSAVFNTPIGVAAEGYGNVYVADYARIRKINSAGVVSTIAGDGTDGYADGTGTAAKFGGVSGVTIDGLGNVYVADQTNNRIRKITPASVVTTFAGSETAGSADGTGTAALFNMPWGVATDTANNVYVSDQGNNKIRKITPAGVVTTLAGSGSQGNTDGTGTGATFNSPIGITTDEAGNVYVSDYGNSKIRKITPSGVVTTFAGSGNQDYADGVGSSATFNHPTGVAMDKLGNIYVVDPGNNRIRRITIGGYKITPTLPAGLSFDGKTGIISGTPTVIDSSRTYTITAINLGGQSSYQISLGVGKLAIDSTLRVTNPTETTATVTGNISYLGWPDNPTSYGICWSSTDTLPTIANSKIDKGAATATGDFTDSLTGLTPGMLYYARAYAINNEGVGYSNVVPFNTRTTPPVISYGSAPIHYLEAGSAITPLAPTNTGGAVPATIPDSVFTLLTAPTYTFSSLRGMVCDPEGNLYFPSEFKIKKITPNGVISVWAGAAGGGYLDGNISSAKFNYIYGITSDRAGNIYTTDMNRIRKITREGIVSTVVTFSNSAFANPLSAIAADSSGNVYVKNMDYPNQIVKVTPSGVVSVFAGSATAGYADGTGTSALFNIIYFLASDGGNIYVSDNGNSRIRKITLSGEATTLAGNGTQGYTDGIGTSAQIYAPWVMTLDLENNIYLEDGNKIRKITPSGIVSTIAGQEASGYANGIGSSASFPNNFCIAADARGSLYMGSMNENTRIRKINLCGYKISPTTLPAGLYFDRTTGTITGTPTAIDSTRTYTITAINPGGESSTTLMFKVAHFPTVTTSAVTNITGCTATGNGVLSSTGFPATSAYGICWSSTNALPTIADKKVNHGAATDTVSYSFLMTRLSPNTLYYARAYAVNSDGVIYGNVVTFTTAQLPSISYPASTYNYAVGKAITSLAPTNSGGAVPAVAPGTVTTIAGSTTYGYADGTGSAAMFNIPRGITTDPVGNIYVADAVNFRIRKVTPSGVVTTFAGDGAQTSTDGTGTAASIYFPNALCSDMLGNIYVGETAWWTVRKITPAAVVSTLGGFSSHPSGLSVDYNNNLYIASEYQNLVYKRDTAGVVSVLAGGSNGYVDGIGTAASFKYIKGVTTDTAGNVYVIDDPSIRKITPSGAVSLYAGSYTDGSGYADGPATSAKFLSPYGLTSDIEGSIYVADQSNRRIRRISSSGIVTTLAGNGTSAYVDGIGSSAQFKFPQRLTEDAFGNLYVTDGGCIRKVTLLGYYIYPALPAGLSFDATTGTISGTPTGVTTTQTYTVTAKNIAGESSYTVTLKVDQLPTVTTQAETGITGTTATANGTITSLGSPNPYAYGVCWSSTDTLPTITNSKVNKGAATATGAYSCAMTGLTPGTKYYVRAYATDSAGTVYGNVISFTTAIPAGVSTQAVSSITQTTAVANATLAVLGSPTVTSYGICWSSTNTVPTVSDNIISKGIAMSTGAYTCAMNGLSSETTYYVRAYATNTAGAVYGDVVTFSTSAATKQLSVKIYLESLLSGTSMTACTTDGSTPEFSGAVDTVSVELHNSTTYSTVEYRVNGLYLNTDGSIHASGKTYIEIPGTYTGSYYITVKPRNHLKTTSASAVVFSTTAVSYDFTTAANKAYGSNMKSMSGGVFAFYAGDVNQDGSINTVDDNLVTDANFTEGYSIYDLDGNGMVDNGDVLFVTANIGIVFSHP